MNKNYSSMTVTGIVEEVSPATGTLNLKLLSGDTLTVSVTTNTWYEVLRNVGDENRDRVVTAREDATKYIGQMDENGTDEAKAAWNDRRNTINKLIKYISKNAMVSIRGVASQNNNIFTFSARRVVLMHYIPGGVGWEQTHWWLQQINTLFEQWLDVLFEDKRELTENDFAYFYRTNLDFLGGRTADDTQECATMSRFLYGLSSSYLLTGNDRAFSAAKACAKYLINAFSIVSHDQMYCFWKFGRKHDRKSTKDIIGSLNPDDRGSYALYEQIYALAGLTQYYRITQDTNILSYITKTISAFEKFYRDKKRKNDDCFTGQGGYFSHIDPVTMRPDTAALGQNHMRKNWNSIGDHIPAYLVNLLLAINPLPKSSESGDSWQKLLDLCHDMLDDCVNNIHEYFLPKDNSLFVNERFMADWKPDHEWGWQKNRGIVGHNLKISWNLTRCGHYYRMRAAEAQSKGKRDDKDKYDKLANNCYTDARLLGNNMAQVGVDLIRGGIFDALERIPSNAMPTEFAWETTKDFWQQEQAILAYYIMSGIEIGSEESMKFLMLARYCAAFWNLYFIDHDNRKIYFRTTESGAPIVQDGYDIQGGHAIAGYHSFELNYLAHLYIRTYVPHGDSDDSNFCLTFRPQNNGIKTLNVLPDFFRPEDLIIREVKFDGIRQELRNVLRSQFQIDIAALNEDGIVEVEFRPNHQSTKCEDFIQQQREGIDEFNISR